MGVQMYIDEKYTQCIEHIEKAVSLYYTEAERCRAACEGPYDHEALPDLYNAIGGKHLSGGTQQQGFMDDKLILIICKWY